jgi:hypothetical protein
VALVASGHREHQCATLCAVPFVSSDPDAWMRPYYEVIALQEGFALLPIPIQFAALVDAIAQDHPAKAAKLRDIDDLPGSGPSWDRWPTSFTPGPRRGRSNYGGL